jgi:hypothetical protein
VGLALKGAESMPSNNTFNKANWVAMKGLSLLKNSLAIGKAYSEEYSGEYAKQYAIGRTLTVPMSQRYVVQRNDMTYNPQALDRPVTTITVDQTATIPLEWESIEKALDMERGEERVSKLYLEPAVAYIRQAIESDLGQFAHQNTNMVVGALGTNPATYDATSAAALQALVEMGVPMDADNLSLFLPPAVNRAVKTGALSFFNPTLDISKQFRTGYIQKSDSFDWYASMSLYTHTAGTWAGAVTVNGAGQSGSSLNVTCTTGDTFKKGDKISLANVNQVNLMTRATTSTSSAGTKTFTITADAVGVASAATLSIYPPIYGPGSHYQNVDALPVTTAALTLWPGTGSPSGKVGKVGLGIYPGAFFIVGVDLEEPEAVEICRQYQDPDTGIAVRFIRQWDNTQSRMTNRLDALWGRGVGLAEQCSVCIACA